MQLHDLSDKLATGLDEIRDRTADAVSGDGGSVFRELSKLSKQLSGVEKHLSSRIDDVSDEQTDLIDDLIGASNRTTWPRRLFWLLVGAAAGYGVAYLTDPDRGQDRRRQLGQELGSKAEEVKSQVVSQTEQLREKAAERATEMRDDVSAQATQAIDTAAQKADELRGQAGQVAAQTQGAVIESAKDAMPDRPTEDPKLLEDRIKSQIFGYRDDVQDVIIKVDGPGQVALKGTVPTPQNERELLAAVAQVDGVVDVRSELTVRSI
ncbi:YtxH domain-containing protein [Egicoccus sp. AB-alg6-2]|uniref:YtxH domain-containing protein n=1 Tax=Egicoccus sp. AB-alg6-2 TaxID=3242692 RepID=UPI00359D9289